jgi:signal transduction histidine kinase/FixJ family two-component response regulator
LIVEDSEDDALLLVQELKRGGLYASFQRVESREAMDVALSSHSWDIVFADYTMPHFRGTDALAVVKERNLDIPFIFVSGTIGEDAAVAAMKAGAHDYIMKGNLKRLVPAVEREVREAALRRRQREDEEKIERQEARIGALHQINLAVTSTLELRAVLDLLLEKIDLVFPCAVGTTVRLVDKNSAGLDPLSSRNMDGEEWATEGGKVGLDFDLAAMQSKAPVLVDDLRTAVVADREFFLRHGLVCYLGVPLIAKGEVLGVLGFYAKQERSFTSQEVDFLATVGGQAALAIHHARLFEELKQQALELERANRVKAEFLSIISHELKTPLGVIMGYTGLIKDKLSVDLGHASGRILKYSNDLLGMIESLLEATRIESGAISLLVEQFRIADLLADLRSFYDVPLKQVTLAWDYPSELPEMKSDLAKLRHILHNLINNAIKFTAKGQVIVSVRSLAEATSVEFKVADTGIGIPQDKMAMIFERFEQADSSVSRSYGGAGVGLYIVKTFVGLLGGKVAVESELGKGSIFTVTVPCRIDKPI